MMTMQRERRSVVLSSTSARLQTTTLFLLTAVASALMPVAAATETEGAAGRAVGGIRIVPHYLPSVQSSLSEEQQTMLKDVLLNATLTWFGRVLKVQREQSPLAFERSCSVNSRLVRGRKYCVGSCSSSTKCGPLHIPEEHLQPCRMCEDSDECREEEESAEPAVAKGVPEADLIVYVSIITDRNKCRSQSMAAGHCQRERRLDRPVAAYLLVCPAFLETVPDYYHLQLARFVRHLVHILAFSESLIPFFRDEGGAPRNERDGEGIPLRQSTRFVTDGVVRYYSHTPWVVAHNETSPMRFVRMVITPNVVREVQRHFGCSEMIGGELENQVEFQSPFGDAFWEKRVFGEELMTGALSYHPVLSRLTLALLQDSGWYTPDYSYGASLHWGRGQGCDFIEGSCYKWVWSKTKYGYRETDVVPFCSKRQDATEGCVDQRRAVGVCTIKNYPDRLPEPFTYFFSRRKGGASPMVDYCPIFQYVFTSYRPTGRNCLTPPYTSPMSPVPEEYGPDSRCFEHQLEGGAEESVVGGVSCHTFSCTRDSIIVNVGGSKVNCSQPGEQVSVRFNDSFFDSGSVSYSVDIICPSYQNLCENYDCPRMCSGHGHCDRGHCRCQPGYYGNDCSYSYLDRLLTCEVVVCQNGGSCRDSSSDGGSGDGGSGIGYGGIGYGDGDGGDGSDGGGQFGFICDCVDGYSGMFCESLLVPDPCQNLSCSRNSHCIRSELGTEGRCECLEGYGGEDCEDLLLCQQRGRPCDHGRCQWRDGQPKCVCEDSYRGPLCNRRDPTDDPCLSSPCLYNATCSTVTHPHSGKSSYKCSCLPGFKGRRCGNRKNPCRRPNPCRNGGKCRQMKRGHPELWHLFICYCPPGFSGERCENEL